MKNLITILALSLIALVGCTSSTTIDQASQDVSVNACDPYEGLQLDDAGNVTHGVTQCALCRRYEDAFEARATELGCVQRYPLDGCPIDEGLTDCVFETLDEYLATTIGEITDCDTLVRFTGQVENIGGFTCGDSCTWSNPYANPVTSDVEQEVLANISGDWDHDACDAGTPYAARRL